MSDTVAEHKEKLFSLKSFKLLEILFNDAGRKRICLLGSLSEDKEDRAIVFIEKSHFVADHFTKDDETKSFLAHLELESTLVNSIYADFTGQVDRDYNGKLLLQFC